MKKRLQAVLCAVLAAVLLTGCGIDLIPMPKLPSLSIGSSQLTARVEYVNGRTLRICVTEGDSHFDEGDILQLTFTNLTGSKSVVVGDTVRFRYDYAGQVSEHLGSPHISVNQVQVN